MLSEGTAAGVVPGAQGLEERLQGRLGGAGLGRAGCPRLTQAAPALWWPQDALQTEALRFGGGACLCSEAQWQSPKHTPSSHSQTVFKVLDAQKPQTDGHRQQTEERLGGRAGRPAGPRSWSPSRAVRGLQAPSRWGCGPALPSSPLPCSSNTTMQIPARERPGPLDAVSCVL